MLGTWTALRPTLQKAMHDVRRHVMPASCPSRTMSLMSITVALSPGLRDWLAEGLEQNRSPATMVEALIARQFDPRVASGLVQAFVSARASGGPLPEHTVRLDAPAPEYQYETPRIAAGNTRAASL